MERGSAVAATEGCAGMSCPSCKGEVDVGWKEKVADVIEREDAEHDIQDGTDGTKSEQVENGIRGLKASYGIVESSYGNNDDGPHGSDKKSKREGESKGIERRMVVEMSPLFGTKGLDGGIGCCRTGHENA